MTRDELIQLHMRLTGAARGILAKKNDDYCGVDGDALRTIKRRGLEGVVTRMDDKLSRLDTFTKRGKFSIKESVEETVMDLVNYAILFAAIATEQEVPEESDAKA